MSSCTRTVCTTWLLTAPALATIKVGQVMLPLSEPTDEP